MKNWPLKGRGLGHVTHFEILGPLYIFGMIKVRNFFFGERIGYHTLAR